MQPTRSPAIGHRAVARVRLPLPGTVGNVSKVKDITAGSGQSDAYRYPNISKEIFSRGAVVSSPASCPSPSGVHSVHTPTFMRSLQRSNSAREYRSLLHGNDSPALASLEVLPSDGPEVITKSSSHQLVRDMALFEHPRSQSCEPVVDTSVSTSSVRRIAAIEERIEEVGVDRTNLETPPSVHAPSAEVSPRVLPSTPSESPRNVRRVTPPPISNNRRGRPGSKDSANARGRPGSKDSANRAGAAQRSGSKDSAPRGVVGASRPLPAVDSSVRHRTQSEPPLKDSRERGRSFGKQKNRLAQLVEEVSHHLHGLQAHLPKEGSTWLQEIAQLELYAEEMRWLLDKHENGAIDFISDFPEQDAVAKHPMLLRGDKDIRWVRQQLRMLEQEHAQLIQRLSCVDPSAQKMQAAELKAVENEINMEQKRQKQLVAESRQRGKNLVQNTVDGREIDAKTRSIQQIERLEGELAVWKVKNSSLNKQVQEATQLWQKAQDQYHALGQKAQYMGEALVSDEHATRQAEQRQARESVQNELASLQASLEEMHENRDRALKHHQRHKREHGREVSLLSDNLKELEEQERHLDALERQLQRQLRQQGL